MLVQSGRPVGVLRTHEWAPRVLIANSNLVGDWATWPEFRRLEAARPDDVRPDDRRLVDLHRHPGHPAGHLRDVRRGRRPSGSAARWPARSPSPAGCGGMGGAQPLAVTMNDGVCLVRRRRPGPAAAPRRAPLPRRDRRRPRRRARPGARPQGASGAPCRSGWSATPPSVLPELLRRGVDGRHRHRPDLGPRPARPTCPRASTLERLARLRRAPSRRSSPTGRARRWPRTSRRWSASWTRAPRSSTTATRSATRPASGGFERAFDFPGFVPAYIRPLFCEGKGPFRWAALSGDPRTSRATDRRRARPVPRQRPPAPLDRAGPGAGRASRGCRRGSAGSATASATRPGSRSTTWSPRASCRAPIVIGRDHLDCGSVASPYRETEAMPDGSDAIADWPLLNALVNTASRRDLGVDPPRRRRRHRPLASTPARSCVADGTALAAAEARAGADQRPGHGRDPPRRRRLRRGPRDRHAQGVRIPMAEG